MPDAGLDNAGKTTLLYRLRDGTLASFVPTQRAQVQEMVRACPPIPPGPAALLTRRARVYVWGRTVPSRPQQVGALTVRAWDLGGHEAVRQLWRDYYLQAEGILFMVDAADPDRFDEARGELDGLMEDTSLPPVPVAVLANKADLPVRGAGETMPCAVWLARLTVPPSSVPGLLRCCCPRRRPCPWTSLCRPWRWIATWAAQACAGRLQSSARPLSTVPATSTCSNGSWQPRSPSQR